MPLDAPELWGTEEDGSPNHDYCKYCYQNGSFTNPGITLEEMKSLIIDRMEKEQIPVDIIGAAVSRLTFLKRWKNSATN